MNINEYRFFIGTNPVLAAKVRRIIRTDYPSFEDKLDDLADLGIVSRGLPDDMLSPRYREEIELYDYLHEQYS